ncbi:hypothetical protein DV738_g3727, partial [Chaetothyriales sp. CBS 135597]
MGYDPFWPICLATVNVLVVPAGAISLRRFDDLFQILSTVKSIALGDINLDGIENDLFFSAESQSGFLLLNSSKSLHQSSVRRFPFEINADPQVVLGIYDASVSDNDQDSSRHDQSELLQSTVSNFRSHFQTANPNATAVILGFGLDATTDQQGLIRVTAEDNIRVYQALTRVSRLFIDSVIELERTLADGPLENPQPISGTQNNELSRRSQDTNSSSSQHQAKATKSPSLPAQVAIQSTDRHKGRFTICLGFLNLLVGSWQDATRRLSEGAALASESGDKLWHARALEGLLVCMTLQAWQGAEYTVPELFEPSKAYAASVASQRSRSSSLAARIASMAHRTDATKLSPLERWVQLAPFVSNLGMELYAAAQGWDVPQMIITEARFRLINILAFCQAGATTAESLDRFILSQEQPPSPHVPALPRGSEPSLANIVMDIALSAGLTQNLSDTVAVLAAAVTSLANMGSTRKHAFLFRSLLLKLGEALGKTRKWGSPEASISTTTTPSSLEGNAFTQLRSLLVAAAAASNIHITDFPDPGQINTHTRALSRLQSWAYQQSTGDLSLKLELLQACILACDAMPDIQSSLAFTSELLRLNIRTLTLSNTATNTKPWLSSEDQSRYVDHVRRAAAAATRQRLEGARASYWDDWLVRDVQLLQPPNASSLTSHQPSELPIVQDAVADGPHDPFIFNPFARSVSESTTPIVVAGEQISFSVLLQNPLEVEIDIPDIRLLTEGADFEASHHSIILGPFCSQTVVLAGLPRTHGSLKVLGCRATVDGCYQQDFPIYRDEWLPSIQVKVKRLTAKSKSQTADPAEPPVDVKVPDTSTVSLRVIDPTPQLQLQSPDLAQPSVMLLEGEKISCDLIVKNISSSIPADLLLFSFHDNLSTGLQETLRRKDLSPAEIYEIQYQLKNRQTLQVSTKDEPAELRPGAERRYSFDVFGRAGLCTAAVQVNFAHLGKPLTDVNETFYTRHTTFPLSVTVNGSIEVQRCSVLPVADDFNFESDHSSTALKATRSQNGYCLLSLDLCNVWPHPLSVRLSSSPIDGEEELKGENSEKGNIDLRKGISLAKFGLGGRMVEGLRVESVDIDFELKPDDAGDDERGVVKKLRKCHFQLATESFATLHVRVHNRSSDRLSLLLRLQPSLKDQPHPVALDLWRRFSWSGLLQQVLHPALEPGEVREAKLGILVLSKGVYEVSASVEEVRAERKGRNRDAAGGGRRKMCSRSFPPAPSSVRGWSRVGGKSPASSALSPSPSLSSPSGGNDDEAPWTVWKYGSEAVGLSDSMSLSGGDTNALMILPGSKDSQQQQQLKPKQNGEEDQQEQQPRKVSGKKAKRLEKYIEKKLKKDEAMGYLRLLEDEEAKKRAEKGHQEDSFVERVKLQGKKRKREEEEAVVGVVENKQAEDGGDQSEDEWEAEHPEAFSKEAQTLQLPQAPVQQGIGLAKPLQLGADAEQGEKPRTSAFKAWATQQINQAIGHTPSYDQPPAWPSIPKKEAEIKPVITPSITPAPPPPPPASNRTAFAVHITRSPEIEASRSSLPILAREQEVMEAIHNNNFVIVTGSTGSGKTTQLPQFLYEAGYGCKDGPTPGMIGITQPRRIAATSMAERVAVEMGDHGKRVGYQIRYESKAGADTAVKFMTDGILIRELQEDLLLKRYSALIIDEAHERSVNTDVLIGILSKVVPARLKKSQWNPDPKPLKVVVMSATLHVDPFLDSRLFKPGERPPIVEVEGRQHNVAVHFALRSRADYVEEVVEKVRRAHRKLPKGGILVFLTGQQEIKEVGRRLQKLLVKNSGEFMGGPRVQVSAKIIADEDDDEGDDEEKEFDISDHEQEDSDQPTTTTTSATASKIPYTSAHILPLYAQLPKHAQNLIFQPAPPEARLIVLATNVAETSITIPNIRYVFDTGRAKTRKHNIASATSTSGAGVQSFEIDYISKASASQRAGRAGRTGPGHCWRLYTSAVYEQFFPDFSEPQILTEPAESVVLMLKGIDYPKPIREFPFPTVPQLQALERAEALLRNLGALDDQGKITMVGRELGKWPLGPRLAKCMATAVGTGKGELVSDCIRGVAGLAVGEVFVSEAGALEGAAEDEEQQQTDERDSLKQAYGRARAMFARQDKTSDAMKIVTAVSMYDAAAADRSSFCQDYFLRPKAMAEVSELEHQLTRIVKFDWPQLAAAALASNSAKECQQINAIFASGYIDQVAIRADLSPNPPEMPAKPKRPIDVPYLPLVPLPTTAASANLVDKAVFLHPSSVLTRLPVRDLPKFVVYTHLQKSQARTVGGETVPKTRMFPLAPVDAATLVQLARDTPLLEFGKPVSGGKIEELKGVPKRRECVVAVELRAGKSGFGWPLGAVRVRQVVDVKSRSGWRTEEVL